MKRHPIGSQDGVRTRGCRTRCRSGGRPRCFKRLDRGVGFPRLSNWHALPWPGIAQCTTPRRRLDYRGADDPSQPRFESLRRSSGLPAEDLAGNSAANQAQAELSERAATGPYEAKSATLSFQLVLFASSLRFNIVQDRLSGLVLDEQADDRNWRGASRRPTLG
jgi:hypothetical protein